MSIRHVIYSQEPGIDGTGITSIEKAQLVDDVARVAPQASAPAVGATVRQGPTGPAWMKDAVSADWYSDPNDAIAAAGLGGHVAFSADTVYNLPTPLRIKSGVQLIGGDQTSTVLKGPGGAAPIVVDNPAVQTLEVLLDNMRIDANGADMGVDFRHISHSSIDRVTVEGVAAGGKGVYFGGDNDFLGGWSIRLWRSRVRGVFNGSSVFLGGATGSNVPNANFIQILGCVIYVWGPDSVGIHVDKGEQNVFMSNDIGYGDGMAFKLGAQANFNRSVANRSELVDGFAEVAGSQNQFIADHMHMKTPATRRVVNVTGGQYNRFEPSFVSSSGPQPWYGENDPVRNTLFVDPTHETFGQRTMQYRTNGDALRVAMDSDAQDRFRLNAQGSMYWGDGVNAPAASLFRRGGDGDMQLTGAGLMMGNAWNSGNLLRMGSHRFWMDGSGRLRVKNGVPTSDTDGTVVGSQS